MSAIGWPVLVVLSDPDPVARSVGAQWGSLPATGDHVDGASVRALGDGLLVVRRPGPHLYDDHLERRLPKGVLDPRPTLLFPSVHRSESGQHCLTVHPLGNPTARADLGGRPRSLVPTDPRGMAAVLRELDLAARSLGTTATYEATHHGPELDVAAMFAEVAVGPGEGPSNAEVEALARAIREAKPDPRDRVALAAGGGHYAPRFTDLALGRRWAFGHILSRHALGDLDRVTGEAALRATPDAEGIVFARAQDRQHTALGGLAPELRESAAPNRTPTSTTLPTSGT